MSRGPTPPHDPFDADPFDADPLDLEATDRRIRINELTEEAKALGMGPSYVSDDCPSEEHEQFLRDMLHFESGPLSTQFAELENAGVELPPPEALDDATLYAKLWEVIHSLASRDTFLYHTDHLSDRQLYEELWHDTLREETTIMPAGSGWRQHIDLIGSGSDEDFEIGLRYYDTEEDRQRWASEFPDIVIPPHEEPPYDRDRLLPSADDEAFDSDEGDEEAADKSPF